MPATAKTPPQPRKPKARPVPDTLADVLRQLGDIPPHRILWTPLPGTATEADAIRALDGEPKLRAELVDRILILKGIRREDLTAYAPATVTLADVLDRLGGVPPERILWTPLPGTATEADVLRYLDREPKRLVELIDGVLVEKAMGAREGFLAITLRFLLGAFVRLRNLGMIGGEAIPVRVSPTQTRMPDVHFTSWARLGGVPFRAVVPVSPDLAVEILSPSNTVAEIARKIREYFKAGTQLVWVFDPDAKTVTVYTSPKKSRTLTATDTLDGGKALPGFTLDLNEFWNDPQVAYFPTT